MQFNVGLSYWRLQTADGVIRLPSRNQAMRPPNFEDRYDAETVFYDVFWDENYRKVVIVAAPLLGLPADLPFTLRAVPSATPCEYSCEPRPHNTLITLTPPPGTHALEAAWGDHRIVLPIQPCGDTLFAGRNVIYTLQRDNDLVWIRDWAHFYAREHGADAAIVYDNGSTRYSRAEVANTLASVAGIEDVAVVDWPFPYGAFDCREELSFNIFDAAYCQVAGFEHVRRRFAPKTRALANVDLDELIVRRGTRTMFDAAAQAPSGFVRIFGYWNENARSAQDAARPQRRHRDFPYVSKPEPRVCESKWVVVPERLSHFAMLHIHDVYNARTTESADFCLYHFRGINTMWDSERLLFGERGAEFIASEEAHQKVPELAEAMARAFDRDDDGAFTSRVTPPRPEIAAHVARMESGRAAARGDGARALALAREAIALAPAIQSYHEHLASLLAADDPEAKAARERAAALREADFGSHFIKGFREWVLSGPAGALGQFERAMALDPDNPSHVFHWLACLLALDRMDDIVAAIPKAMAVMPDGPIMSCLVAALTRTGEGEAAIGLCEEAAARNPDDAGVHGLLARAYLREGRLAEARAALAAANRLATHERIGDRLARISLNEGGAFHAHANTLSWSLDRGGFEDIAAELAEAEGRPAEALAHMREYAWGRYPHAPVFRRLVQLYADAGDKEGEREAEAVIGRIVGFAALTQPTPDEGAWKAQRWRLFIATEKATWLVRNRRLEEADATLRQYGDVVGAELILACARLAMRTQMPEWAERWARMALGAEADLAEGHLVLARALLARNKSAEAIAAAQQAVALAPDMPDAHVTLMHALQAGKRGEEVAGVAGTVIALAPDHVPARTALFNTLLQNGETEAALEAAKAAQAAFPQVAVFAINVVRAHLALNEAEAAQAVAEAACARWPKHFDLHFLHGQCLMRLERPGEALAVAKAALAIDPAAARGYNLAARAAIQSHDFAYAVEAFRGYIAHGKDLGPAPYLEVARLLLRQHRFAEALEALDQAIAHGAKDAGPLRERALAGLAQAPAAAPPRQPQSQTS